MIIVQYEIEFRKSSFWSTSFFLLTPLMQSMELFNTKKGDTFFHIFQHNTTVRELWKKEK